MSEEKCNDKNNQNSDELRILAFSDWHVQSIDALVEFVKSLESKPDVIFYGGDAFDRFVSLTEQLLYDILKENDQSFADSTGEVFINPTISINTSEPSYSRRSLNGVMLFYFQNEMIKLSKEGVIIFLSNYLIKKIEIKGIGERWSENIEEYVFMKQIFRDLEQDYNIESISLENLCEYFEKFKICFKEEDGWIKGIINHSEYDSIQRNYFHQLAKLSKFGLCFVLGNDDELVHNKIDLPRNIHNVHKKPFEINEIAIIGQEGSPSENTVIGGLIKKETCMGNICYSEKQILKHLMKSSRKYKGKKQIIISHCPPYGILDEAERYGKRNIGSKSLREYIEKNEPALVVAGHVHKFGGMNSKFRNTHIVNTASHQYDLEKGNVSIINIKQNKIDVKWETIPSNFEILILSSTEEELKTELNDLDFIKYESESKTLLGAINQHGEQFISDLPNLYWNIKKQYGFSLLHLVELYELGVRKPEDIKKEHIHQLLKKIKNGFSKKTLRQAGLKLFAERLKEIVIFDDNFDWVFNDKKAYLDTEYVDSNNVILYGFLVDNKVKQFVIGEEDDVIEFVESLILKNYKIYFYGGADKKAILNLFKSRGSQIKNVGGQFVNVLYNIQRQVGLPIESNGLNDVANYFQKSENINNPIDLISQNGMIKSMMCSQTIKEYENGKYINDLESFSRMKEINKSDIFALEYVVNKVNDLITKSIKKAKSQKSNFFNIRPIK